MARTTLTAHVTRVVDGDTIRVAHEALADGIDDEALRILSLDTEETNPSGGKPVTPWGHEAKRAAEAFFDAGDPVSLEFPGDEPLEECLVRYRGNYGRLLVHVDKDGVDFQEHMIGEGFSPYFMKYGHAPDGRRARYETAERLAQAAHVGIWNQLGVNGSEVRNYAALSTWWRLRGEIVDDYRRRFRGRDVPNSRLDYASLIERAGQGDRVTLFTELRELKRVGDRSAVVRIGSREQPFSVFVPDVESEAGRRLVWLLETRYFPGDDAHPRRGYAYVEGALSLYRGAPQIVVESTERVLDEPAG